MRDSSLPSVFYLVRHAEAGRSQGGDDPERRLTAEGRAAFAALARALAKDLPLSRIRTSPYARARETAELLGEATGAPLQAVASLAPGRSDGQALLELGRAAEPGTAVVGHNPEVAEAVILAAGRSVQVPPGTVAAVETGPGGLRLVWLRAP
jgi:phosphohistidine phosphatase